MRRQAGREEVPCKRWLSIQVSSHPSKASTSMKARRNEIGLPQGVFQLDIWMEDFTVRIPSD